MTSMIVLVSAYMLVSIGIGLWAARRVHTTEDFALAGRSLPLAMVIATTFATWFGSETVLGLPGRFIEGGFCGVIGEPFGAGAALILVGMFFSRKLYRMRLLTIGDFYRERFSKKVELACSLFIVISYLGWVGAQVTALGLVLNLLTEGVVSVSQGMMLGTLVVLIYTVYGGLWSVALTDFLQMSIIVLGLVAIAFVAGGMAGGADKVVEFAASRDLFRFFPEMNCHSWIFWISAAITVMIGSIPQQDVFQRVMSAKNEKICVRGPIFGGVFYVLFAFVPMFIVCAAVLAMPGVGEVMLKSDPQELLPTLVRDHMPVWLRVIFFGAVLSAVMSTASATMLAPTTAFVHNVLRNYISITPENELAYFRGSLVVFAVAVLVYSRHLEGTAIYDMVAMAYQFPVVGAFWPLVAGLYWKRATTQGAWVSIILGAIAWTVLTTTPLGEIFPSVLGSFLVAGFGMVVGSLVPTRFNEPVKNRCGATQA